jgi:RNA-binding protein
MGKPPRKTRGTTSTRSTRGSGARGAKRPVARSSRARAREDRRKEVATPSAPSKETQLIASRAQSAPVLEARERKSLRAKAHHLLPLVHVGHAGVTDAIVAATAQALLDHELIKVRLHEPEDKSGMAETLATRARAALCGMVGHTVILYKPRALDPSIRP